MTAQVVALGKGTPLDLLDLTGLIDSQTQWITVTADLVHARTLVWRWREHNAEVTAEHFPNERQAVITAEWPVAKLEVVVSEVFDDDGLPWWQRLGLRSSEVTR